VVILKSFSSPVHLRLKKYRTINFTLISGNVDKTERKNKNLMVKGGTFDYSFFPASLIVRSKE
jgi:hypothetical protein